MADKKEQVLSFKGKPLVRSGDTLFYGDLAEPYFAMLQITETKKEGEYDLPSTIAVQILSTNEDLPILERIKNNSVQDNLYDAVNIAAIWLERILRDEDTFEDEK